jgi:hypothetical protein
MLGGKKIYKKFIESNSGIKYKSCLEEESVFKGM